MYQNYGFHPKSVVDTELGFMKKVRFSKNLGCSFDFENSKLLIFMVIFYDIKLIPDSSYTVMCA